MSHLEKKIERFLNNEANAEEAEEVFLYFEAHPEIAEKYISQEALLGTVEKERIPEEVTDRMRERLKAHMKDRWYHLWGRYAAAAAIIGVLATGALLWAPPSKQAANKGIAGAGKHAVTADSLVSVENRDKKSRIEQLDDGSVVTLNQGAKIRFHQSFGVSNRDIELTGNAVFKVARNTSNPFSVTSRGITTTALGTEFRIEPDVSGIRISLYEGKVKVRQQMAAENTAVVMEPGQVLHVNSVDFACRFEGNTEKNKPVRSKVPVDEMEALPDSLVFRKAPLRRVFKRIEEDFQVKIVYTSGTIGEKARFTGSFTKKETPENIIATLCTINGLIYSVNGDTVTITKK